MGQMWGLSPSLSQKLGLGLRLWLGLELGLRLSQRDPRGVVGVGLELGRSSHSGDIGCSRTTNTAKQRHPVAPLSEETAGFLSLYPLIKILYQKYRDHLRRFCLF